MSVFSALWGTVVHRPYVFALLGSYLVVATLHLGARRTGVITIIGYFIAWASEKASITWGIPYGLYTYHRDPGITELWFFGVPFFDSVSYTFLAYASWSTALALVCPLRGRGIRARTVDEERWRFAPRVILLGAFLMAWIDVVIDPIAHRGEQWFLGKVYHYETPGPYFDVPFSNFAGWFLVGAILVALIGFVDRRMRGVREWGRREVPFQPFLGPGLYFGTVIFILSVAAGIGSWDLFWAGFFVQGPILVWLIHRWTGGEADRAADLSQSV